MPKVAFVHHEVQWKPEEVAIQRALAERMVKSVRKFHPDWEIVQISDPKAPNLGADSVSRSDPKNTYAIPWLMEQFAKQPAGTLFLDSDVVLRKPIGHIWEEDFDIAVTGRPSRFAVYTDSEGVKHNMPFNLGVCFSRSPGFWAEIKKRVEQYSDPNILGWWGAQIELWKLWNEKTKWKMVCLDAGLYNYTPNDPGEDFSGRLILHYKGAHRKHWNLDGDWKEQPRKREILLRVA